jgi:hypothetical protein
MQLVEPSVEACRRNPVRRDRTPLAGVQETNAGTVATARGPGGRNCVGSRPKLPRASGRRQVRGSERGDDGTHAHNTLSVDNTDVQVFYPFHPVHGVTLRILRRPKRGDGAVCVIDPAGKRLKIPTWMLLPESAEITISQRPHLSKQALLSLASLIASQLDSPCPR